MIHDAMSSRIFSIVVLLLSSVKEVKRTDDSDVPAVPKSDITPTHKLVVTAAKTKCFARECRSPQKP